MERVTGNGRTSTKATNLAALEERLDKLALAVHDGQPGAREEYDMTRAEIERLRGDEDLQARAGKARAVRDEAEGKARAEARQRELERRFAELGEQLKALAPGVDQAATTLFTRASEFLLVAEDQYRVANELGQHRPRLRRGDLVANVICWHLSQLPQLAEVLPRPDRYYRRRLTEILGETPAPGHGA